MNASMNSYSHFFLTLAASAKDNQHSITKILIVNCGNSNGIGSAMLAEQKKAAQDAIGRCPLPLIIAASSKTVSIRHGRTVWGTMGQIQSNTANVNKS
ncbi:MAG TPA: hypothetical protein VGO57_09510 [Verrucomicrobiae bacterium]|jgi:hypothetical protein